MSQNRDKPYNLKAVTLQLPTSTMYQENLEKLLSIIQKHQESDIVVCPEVYLTGFAYHDMQEAARFSEEALAVLCQAVQHQIVVLSVIREVHNGFVNQSVVIHQHQIIHQQNKVKLFRLGEEERYFQAGEVQEIVRFEIEGVAYALLLCFELRFKSLWECVEGADIIFIPAQWGKPRKTHLEVLSRALAIMNQCYVIVSNSADTQMGGGSRIISPFGEVEAGETDTLIEGAIDFKEIERMRRYIIVE